MTKSNKEPNGHDLLELLVKLLGEQEGVEIKCVYENKEGVIKNEIQTLQTR